MSDKGIHELYDEDPEKADETLWGRKTDPVTRRGFLRNSGLAAMAIALGAKIPFADNMPGGLIPVAFAETDESFILKSKDGLRILNDRPINAETPPHLLDNEVTPANRLFVRNNGLVPEMALKRNPAGWTLTIDGEVNEPLTLTLDDLKKNFQQHTYQLMLECGGNGRAGYHPSVRGNQWSYGAVGCPSWTGVRLKDILEKAGLKPSAVYTAYYSMDIHVSQDPEKVVISRGTPIKKALDDYTLIATQMNGKPLPPLHGFPARIVCPGYPGSASGKWIKRITIRDQVHDGPKMTGFSYRVPRTPVKPGTEVAKGDMVIIEQMPVKSLITHPKSNVQVSRSRRKGFYCRGFAWTGHQSVTDVSVTYDFGQTWVKAKLKPPKNRFAWQRWEAIFDLPSEGYYEIWARATDTEGKMQPMVVPGWNPRGYLNNAMPRIAVTVI